MNVSGLRAPRVRDTGSVSPSLPLRVEMTLLTEVEMHLYPHITLFRKHTPNIGKHLLITLASFNLILLAPKANQHNYFQLQWFERTFIT